jgi:hypothetical protein
MASSPRWLFVYVCVCAYKIVALESDDHELFWIDHQTPELQLECVDN